MPRSRMMGNGLMMGGLNTAGVTPYATKVTGIANLTAYWKLIDTSGTTAVDSSGNGYNASPATGVAWADTAGAGASMGLAPRFDGTNDFISIATNFQAIQTYRDTGTLSLWYKASSYAADQRIFRFTTAGTNPNGFEIQMRVNSGTLWLFSRAGADATLKTVSFNPASPAGWTNAILTWSTVANEVRAYINNVEVGTPITTGVVAAATADLLIAQSQIGANTNVPGAPTNGWLHHVAIYSRVVTAGERAILATAV